MNGSRSSLVGSRDAIPAHEKAAGALRSHDVFVPAEGVEIAVERAHIDLNRAVGLRAVEQNPDIPLMGDVDQRARRQSLSRAAADVADRDDTRAPVEQLFELVQHALFVVDHLQEAQFDAIALYVAVPGDAVAGMLLVAQDDVVPGPAS